MKNNLLVVLSIGMMVISLVRIESTLAQPYATSETALNTSHNDELPQFRIGFSYSQLSSYGFHVSYMFDKRWSTSVIFLAFRGSNNGEDISNSESNRINIGIEIKYGLSLFEGGRFYFFLGGGLLYEDKRSLQRLLPDFSFSEAYDQNRRFNIGAGIGVDYSVFKWLVVHLETGLRYSPFSELREGFFNGNSSINGSHIGMGFGGGLSIAF